MHRKPDKYPQSKKQESRILDTFSLLKNHIQDKKGLLPEVPHCNLGIRRFSGCYRIVPFEAQSEHWVYFVKSFGSVLARKLK